MCGGGGGGGVGWEKAKKCLGEDKASKCCMCHNTSKTR